MQTVQLAAPQQKNLNNTCCRYALQQEVKGKNALAKELADVKQQAQHFTRRVEKEKEALRMELNKAKQQIKEADTAIGSQKAEIEKLNHIINEADQERIRQKKEYDIVVNERDILGTQ
eukprot:scaffold98718_cov19-Tisochrysis_lutea.AAC.3